VLEVNNNRVITQDIGPDLPVDLKVDVSEIPSNTYEVVTAFDVVEHVVNDIEFVNHLLRISSKYIVLSTPNTYATQGKNQFHCRDYTPAQFARFGRGYKTRYLTCNFNGFEPKDVSILSFLMSYSEHMILIIEKEERKFREDRFSIILPTVGRPALKNQLYSVLKQPGWKNGDELIIACDGFGERVRSICDPIIKEMSGRCVRYVDFEGYKDYGHTPRNLLMPQLEGEYCIHVDDDDVMTKDFLSRAREDIKSKSHTYLYRLFLAHLGDYIWKEKHTGYGNVSTQCIVHRLDWSSYGIFESTIGGDWSFIRDTVELNYDSVEFKETFSGIMRPETLIYV